MDKAPSSIIDEYLSYVKLYETQYDKYLVLLAVGSFYEIYSTDPNDTKLKAVCELLNIILTRKNKSISKISKANPWMAGVPCCSLDKYLNILIDNQYTVIVYNQEDIENSKKKVRKLDKIYSIGTNVNCEKDSGEENVILSIYRESIINTYNNILGISIINLSTGNVDMVEIYNEDDITKLLEDLNKIIIVYKPKEIIYNYTNVSEAKDQIYNMLNNNNKIFHHNTKTTNDFLKISYQNEFLKNVYKNYNMGFLNSIEYLNIEKYNHSRISLIILLNFAYKYDNMLIENINIPNILNDNDMMNLHNNALEQLNVFSTLDKKSQIYKYNSLYDVINKNSTKLGMRLLKKMLAEPSTKIKELNERYEIVEKLITKGNYLKYESELKNIIDIEKYHKSLGIKKLQPYQYGRLNNSYLSLLKLINISKSDFKDNYDYSILNEYNSYYEEYKKYFNIGNLEVYSFTNKNNTLLNIFNKNIILEVDNVYNIIQSEKNKLDVLVNDLSKLIDDNKASSIKIKNNDTGGYFLELTKVRATKLKKIIDAENIYLDLVFENKIKSSTYITSKSIKEISKNIIINEQKLYEVMKESYYNITNTLYNKYYKVLVYLNYFVSRLDVFTSFANVSVKNNYSKPIINNNSTKSYIDVKNIRHPIIELLENKVEYVTNDLNMNTKHMGTLLYGVNGSGKCLSPDTLVIMFDGTRKKASDIYVGDMLMGDDSTVRNVITTTKGVGQMYEIIPSKGDPFKCNSPHVLSLISSGYQTIQWDGICMRYRVKWNENHILKSRSFSVSKYKTKEIALEHANEFKSHLPSDNGKIIDISVENFMKQPAQWKINYYLYRVGINYDKQAVDIDPYMLGYWLGDGTSSKSEITTADFEIVNYFNEKLKLTNNILVDNKVQYRYTIVGKGKGKVGGNNFLNGLRKYNILNNKHIPDKYLKNNKTIRLELLAGLIDSDGYLNETSFEFVQKNELLFDNVIELVRSLGMYAYKTKTLKKCHNNGKIGEYYRCSITGTYEQMKEIPTKIYRKQLVKEKLKRDNRNIVGFKIKKIDIGEYCGFELDGNHRFLLNDFTVTHNSSIMKALGLNLIMAQIGCYTASSNFEYYPYNSLFTRVDHSDNIFKGYSSYEVEIMELKNILKYSNENSLVLGDELLSSTESISAISIIAATINYFLSKNISFLFASHIFEIAEHIELNVKDKLLIGHLKTEYDNKNKSFIYNRKLQKGLPNANYGLIVASSIIGSSDIISSALKIQNKILNNNKELLEIKKSRYNKQLNVDSCYICKDLNISKKLNEVLDVHHIVEQSMFSNNKCLAENKEHLKKNQLSNLVVLCKQHHIDVHNKKIIINGWLNTTNGIKLDYKN